MAPESPRIPPALLLAPAFGRRGLDSLARLCVAAAGATCHSSFLQAWPVFVLQAEAY